MDGHQHGDAGRCGIVQTVQCENRLGSIRAHTRQSQQDIAPCRGPEEGNGSNKQRLSERRLAANVRGRRHSTQLSWDGQQREQRYESCRIEAKVVNLQPPPLQSKCMLLRAQRSPRQ
ncbi:hypothetical protein MTO96_001238 [Rhipicephalus appendiculatus]